MNRLTLTLSVLIVFLLSSPSRAQMGLIEKDKRFPNFAFPTLEGTPASIDDFRGKDRKVLLVNFASW